ncbi:MAG: hypothetical protein LUH22_04690 [Bacteroides sp.]|nr:hypothetical protein [Bacteroides sp.]
MRKSADFIKILSVPISQFQVMDLVYLIDSNPEDFPVIYQLMEYDEIKISWKSMWVCEKLSKTHPEWFSEHIYHLIQKLLICQHDGSKRLLLSILYNIPLPLTFPVSLYDFCLSHMLDLNESVGVQSVAIKLAYKLCCREPELLYELKVYLENAEAEYYSTAVKTCIRKTLQRIG